MITAEWLRMMARYGGWQNAAYVAATADLSEDAWWQDRGVFFKSLGATANHILWADLIWLSRLAGYPVPEAGPSGLDLTATRADWAARRAQADEQMSDWAAGLTDADLTGDLEWVSGIFGPQKSNRAVALTHLITHATHHRGQMHAMLTAMGRDTPTTDLVFMPEGR